MTNVIPISLPLMGIPLYATPQVALLDGAADFIGGVFIAPKTGTIDRIVCRCTAKTGTAPTITAKLVTVNAGVPTTTLFAANTSGTFTPAANTTHTVTLTGSASVNAGDLIAVVLVGESGGIDASNNATFNLRLPQTIFATGADPFYPAYVQDLSVGTFTHPSTGVPCCVPLYSDGVYLPWCVPHVASSNSDFANNSTPDERGVRWTQIGNMTCAGASVYLRGLTAGGNANVKLYAVGNDSAAPLASFTITHSTFFIGTGVQQVAEVHWAGVDLTDGSDYRLTVQPSTTNTIRQTSLDLLSQAAREALSPYWQTTRTRTADGDAGAWTDDKNKFEVLWPLFSALTSGAGGGGLLRHPGMSGGLSA